MKKWTWIMLFSRIFLFIGLQAVLAVILMLFKVEGSWKESTKWWPFILTTTNVICLFLLTKLFKKDNKNYFDIIKFDKSNIKKDLFNVFIILLLLFPIAFLPNIILSNVLFNDILDAVSLLVTPLPIIVIIAFMVVFPATQGLVEIPVYFSYVMPKLQEQGYKKWVSILIPALMLGLQHIAVPFILNINYLIWRGLMFLPFAILIGIIMDKKPKLFPYLAFIHILMDLSFCTLFFVYAV